MRAQVDSPCEGLGPFVFGGGLFAYDDYHLVDSLSGWREVVGQGRKYR